MNEIYKATSQNGRWGLALVSEERREMMRRVIWPAHLAYMRDPQ